MFCYNCIISTVFFSVNKDEHVTLWQVRKGSKQVRQTSAVSSGDEVERAWRPLRHISRAVMRHRLHQVRAWSLHSAIWPWITEAANFTLSRALAINSYITSSPSHHAACMSPSTPRQMATLRPLTNDLSILRSLLHCMALANSYNLYIFIHQKMIATK